MVKTSKEIKVWAKKIKIVAKEANNARFNFLIKSKVSGRLDFSITKCIPFYKILMPDFFYTNQPPYFTTS